MSFNEPNCTLRSFVFPFTMRGASTTPLLPTVLAFGFCSLNGFFQAHSIIHNDSPGDKNYARMFAGEPELKMKYIITFNLHNISSNKYVCWLNWQCGTNTRSTFPAVDLSGD